MDKVVVDPGAGPAAGGSAVAPSVSTHASAVGASRARTTRMRDFASGSNSVNRVANRRLTVTIDHRRAETLEWAVVLTFLFDKQHRTLDDPCRSFFTRIAIQKLWLVSSMIPTPKKSLRKNGTSGVETSAGLKDGGHRQPCW